MVCISKMKIRYGIENATKDLNQEITSIGHTNKKNTYNYLMYDYYVLQIRTHATPESVDSDDCPAASKKITLSNIIYDAQIHFTCHSYPVFIAKIY